MNSKKKRNNRRYYLHRKVKETDDKARVVSRERTVFVPYQYEPSRYVGLLMDIGYGVQTEI